MVMKVKNKKICWVTAIAILLVSVVLAYLFKPMTMDDIYDEPNFKGVVTEVYDKGILVSVNEDEDEFKSSDKINVSLDVKLKDSMTNFEVGDKVRVFYDGTILESYPAQIHTVYAVLLIGE